MSLVPTEQEELEVACQAYLFERRAEFIRPSATVAGEFVILEGELARCVAEFLRGRNRLN